MNTEINDKLDLMIAYSAKECGSDDVEMFRSLDTTEVSLSKEFYIKKNRTISRYKRKPALAVLRKCLVRAAVALMAVMAFGFLTVMAIPDLREAVFEAVVEWYENYISIRFEPGESAASESADKASDTNGEPGSEQIAVPPTTIEKVMKPTYIPDGAEEDVVISNKTSVMIDYYIGDELCCNFGQYLLKDGGERFDNTAVEVSSTEICGYTASIIKYADNVTKGIAWTDGEYYYHILTETLDMEDIMKMAQSIYHIN